MKAFLCHASEDKPFVEEVARRLGREYVVYDQYSFDHGDEFREEILRGLGKSNIFVLFVSQIALAKLWVKFEIGEAERRLLGNELSKAIGVRINGTVRNEQLPNWLQSVNCPSVSSPAATARLIRTHINEQKRASSPALLIGRRDDLEKAERALAPVAELRPPGIIVLWGLPGIGRRSVGKRVMRDVLDLERSVNVSIESGDTAADLRLKLADLFEISRTQLSYETLQRSAEQSSTEENIQECLRYFELAMQSRELVTMIDNGGMVDDQGQFLPDFSELLSRIYKSEVLRTIIISRRRPANFELAPGLPIPSVRIDRLSEDNTGILIRQLLGFQKIALPTREVAAIVDRVKGYPPAAYYAVELIKDYGRELLIRDGKPILDFRASTFLRFLETENKFSPLQRKILEILSAYDALPLPVLGTVLQVDQSTIDADATKLLDLALLEIDRDGFYFVSDPIRDVVYRAFGKFVLPFREIASAIDRYLKDRQGDEEWDEPLSLLRAKYKTYVLAGRSRKDVFHIASDLVRLQMTYYHEQDYEKSIEFGKEALSARPDQLLVLNHIARAEAHLEHYDEAFAAIQKIKPLSLKDAKFCEGFVFRKQGKFSEAIAAYSSALALGMRGVAVHRELGSCYFGLGNYKDAKVHLGRAREADPDNKYLLDYEITIAIAEERFDDAFNLLDVLQTVEDATRYLHRYSTFEFAQGRFGEALTAAEKAVRSTSHPHFEVLAQYAKSAIRAKRLDLAEEALNSLRNRFPRIRADIQNGLWARYFLAKGNSLDEAIASWAKIEQKDTPIHRRIRLDILNQKILGVPMTSPDRAAIQAELDELRQQPAGHKDEALELDTIAGS